MVECSASSGALERGKENETVSHISVVSPHELLVLYIRAPPSVCNAVHITCTLAREGFAKVRFSLCWHTICMLVTNGELCSYEIR